MTQKEVEAPLGQESAVIQTPRDFSLVKDDRLKTFLEKIDKKMPPHQTRFTHNEMVELMVEERIPGDAGIYQIERSEVRVISDKIKSNKLTPYYTFSTPGGRARTYHDREEVLANAAIIWVKLTGYGHAFARIEQLTDAALRRLGDDSLKDVIYPPNGSRRFPDRYYLDRDMVRQGSQSIEGPFPNPKQLKDIDMETGDFWKTPLGKGVKEIMEGEITGKMSEPLASKQITTILRMVEIEQSMFISDLAKKGVLRNVHRSRHQYQFRGEHLVLIGLNFLCLQRGYRPKEAYALIGKLVEGTLLEHFWGVSPPYNTNYRVGAHLFSAHSAWGKLPLPETSLAGKTQVRIPKAEDDVDGEEEGMSLGRRARYIDEDLPDEPKARQQTPFEYISGIPSEDLRDASKLTLEDLRKIHAKIPRTIDSVSFADVPFNIFKILVRIAEAERGTLRSPDDLSDRLTYNDLRANIWLAISYLEKYPRIANLADLVSAFKAKLGDKEKAKDSR